jgi:hypothetical protein
MSAVDFPNSPTPGQVFTDNNRSWVWSGSTWDVVTSPANALPVGGDTDAVLAKSSSTNYATAWTNTPTFTRVTPTQVAYGGSFVVDEAGGVSSTLTAGTPYLIAEYTFSAVSSNATLSVDVVFQTGALIAYSETVFSIRSDPTAINTSSRVKAQVEPFSSSFRSEVSMWHNFATDGWKVYIVAQPIQANAQNISYLVRAHQRGSYTNTTGTTGLNVFATPTIWTNTSYTKVTPEAWVNGAPAVLETVQRTGNYTLAFGDEGRVVLMNPSATATVTVPTNASVPFPIGTVIGIYNASAFTVSVAGPSVTLRNVGTISQFVEVSLRKRGTDEWVMVGV